jgi:hypothetical protein
VLLAAALLVFGPGLLIAQTLPESVHNPYPPSLTEARAYTVTAAAPAIDVSFDALTVLEAGRGLLIFNPSVTALAGSLPGREWTTEARRVTLHRGLNVVGYSAWPSSARTAQALCALTRASFVTRLQGTSGSGVTFETYLPGADTPSFTLDAGRAYFVALPSAMELVP